LKAPHKIYLRKCLTLLAPCLSFVIMQEGLLMARLF